MVFQSLASDRVPLAIVNNWIVMKGSVVKTWV